MINCGYLLTPQEVHKMDRTLNLMIKQDEKSKNEESEVKAELKISNEKQESYTIKSQNKISILV